MTVCMVCMVCMVSMVTTMGMECLGLSEVPYSLKTRWQGRLLILVSGADSPRLGCQLRFWSKGCQFHNDLMVYWCTVFLGEGANRVAKSAIAKLYAWQSNWSTPDTEVPGGLMYTFIRMYAHTHIHYIYIIYIYIVHIFLHSWKPIDCILPGAWPSALWQAGAGQNRQGREQHKHCDRQRRGQMPEDGTPVEGRNLRLWVLHKKGLTTDFAPNPLSTFCKSHLDSYFRFSLWVMSTLKIGEVLRRGLLPSNDPRQSDISSRHHHWKPEWHPGWTMLEAHFVSRL